MSVDPLDAWYRAALAETLRPCRELSATERAAKRESDAIQQALLASTDGAAEVHRGAA